MSSLHKRRANQKIQCPHSANQTEKNEPCLLVIVLYYAKLDTINYVLSK